MFMIYECLFWRWWYKFDKILFAFRNQSWAFIYYCREELYIRGEIFWLLGAFPLCQFFPCLFVIFMFVMCLLLFVSSILCVLCICGLLNVESIWNMDAFELLNFYANEFRVIRSNNLVVDEHENYILLNEVL